MGCGILLNNKKKHGKWMINGFKICVSAKADSSIFLKNEPNKADLVN